MLIFGQGVLGRLDAHMLHRIRINFRTDQSFYRVQQRRRGKGPEYSRPGPEGGVVSDILKGQRKIEVLAVHFAAFAAYPDIALTKGQPLVARRNLAAIVELVGQLLQHLGVLLDHGLQNRVRIQKIFDHEVTILGKTLELLPGKCTHG